ncbi:MAG: RluA family pseudouridine synthase [Erysipelotrichaceae bacterium]|nr:RluA family pseudouridine synthase [Erysipelotrichaceae bacterium]
MNNNKKRFPNKKVDKNSYREFTVSHECELLDFLFETHPGQSKNSVKSLLTNHHVTIEGSPVSQYNLKLFPGDTVIIYKQPQRKVVRSKLPIIYEDDHIIVINKPSGLLSIASDNEKRSTAYRILSDYVQQKDKHNRVFIVHRLDEDTSGVLMIAKDKVTQEKYQDNWNDLVSKRGYYAIVDGILNKKQGTITSYLKKNAQNLMYSSKKAGDGQYSVTHYKVIKEKGDYSMLDVNIDSGRKNQIRVHLGDIGHNVVGDDKYGKPTNPLKRLGLHAYELDIKDPYTGKVMKFMAPIPKEFDLFFK